MKIREMPQLNISNLQDENEKITRSYHKISAFLHDFSAFLLKTLQVGLKWFTEFYHLDYSSLIQLFSAMCLSALYQPLCTLNPVDSEQKTHAAFRSSSCLHRCNRSTFAGNRRL